MIRVAPAYPPVLVITGMHRSGTSYVASLLHASGLFLGDRLLAPHPTNATGHFEDLDFYEFNRHILRSYGHSDEGFLGNGTIAPGAAFREQAAPLLRSRRDRGRPWGWKDPRTALLLDFWDSLLPEAHYLFVYRPPWDVVDSLYRRGDPIFGLNPAFALQCWNHANGQMLDFARRHPERVIIRELSQLADRACETLDLLRTRCGIPLGNCEPLFRPELLAAAPPGRAAFLRHAAPDCMKTFAALRCMAGLDPWPVPAPDAVADHEILEHGLIEWHRIRTLESLASEQEASSAASLADAEQRGDELRHANLMLHEELSALRAESRRNEERARDAEQQCDELRVSCSELALRLEAQERTATHELAVVRAEASQHAARADAAERSLHQGLATAQADQRRQEAQAAEAHGELTSRLSAAHDTMNQQNARLAALERMVEDLRSSRSWRMTAPFRVLSRAFRSNSGDLPAGLLAYWSLARSRLSSPRLAARTLSRAFQKARSSGMSGLIASVRAARIVEERRPFEHPHPPPPPARLPAHGAMPPPPPSAISGRRAPLISVLVPVYDTPADVLEAMILSVLNQTSTTWELVLADDASRAAHVVDILARYAAKDSRIRVHRRQTNGGISATTNDALALATGDYVAFVDHDDLLEPTALEQCGRALASTGADAVYTDQDTIDGIGRHVWTFLKPDWSPEYLRHVMYVGHLLVVRRSLAEDLGGFLGEYDGVQDFEFMLRLGEKTDAIAHLPAVLYHWRAIPGSLASAIDAKKGIGDLQRRAVQAHLDRLHVPGVAQEHPRFPHRCTIVPNVPRFPKVSIVIPTKDQPEHIGACLESIYGITKRARFEVVVVDTGTTDPTAKAILRSHPVRLVDFKPRFNFSAANNLGAAAATGDVLVFLNNDTTVISPDWLEHLAFHLTDPNVGAVGPLLTYPDGTVQHAGVVLGARGTADHVMRGFSPDSDGYAGSLSCPREVSAVTGACLAIRRGTFDAIGGWNELYATHYQDVDLCLRLRKKGLRCIFTPDVRLAHHESPSRGDRYDFLDRLLFIDTWREAIAAGDPAYPAACSLERLDYSLRDPGREPAHA